MSASIHAFFEIANSIATACVEGDLQLNNTTSPPLVKICVQGQWGYVCGKQNTWTSENVGVACQQLGFTINSTKILIS